MRPDQNGHVRHTTAGRRWVEGYPEPNRIKKRPRRHGGARLSVFRQRATRRWVVRYVSEVDEYGVVWTWSHPDTRGADFEDWEAAVAFAPTLHVDYGEQCRGVRP